MRTHRAAALTAVIVLAGCTATSAPRTGSNTPVFSSQAPATSAPPTDRAPAAPRSGTLRGMPPLLDSHDVYAADRSGLLNPRVARDPAYVYVPDTNSNDVKVIDQHTMKVIASFPGGSEPQHVVPSYNLRTLFVVADTPGRGSLTSIDPRTGRPGRPIAVDDAYNMYYTPNGQYAIVVQEAYKRLAFYDPHSWRLHDTVPIPSCRGVDHLDFTADGTKLLASCEFAAALAVVDVVTHRLLQTIPLTHVPHGMPQDVKLSPDGTLFYIADMTAGGVYVIDAATFRITRFQPTGAGAHGLYISRDSKRLFVTNRDQGTVSVLNAATGRPQAKWIIPGGGSPDMGNVSADGTVLWLSGRYNNVVYALNSTTGHLMAKIRVGSGPHGLCVWPLPGRYSLGHTGILR